MDISRATFRAGGVDDSMKWHEMGQTELLNITKTSIGKGLTEKEAEKRLERHGTNELQEGEKTSAIALFFLNSRTSWFLFCLRPR